MNDNTIYETLKELIRKKPSYIYLDGTDNKIKVVPLSKVDFAGSALINRIMKQYQYKNPAKLIHNSIFSPNSIFF
jgi:hypothetical protein